MGKPTVTTARSLFEALDERATDAEGRKAFDEAIWAQCGVEGAVLITDLSGFTRTTKTHGILHFLAMFRRFQRACSPVINKHGGSVLKQEADDLFGIFVSASDAVDAGIDMLRAVEVLNETAAPEDQLGLALGVEYGSMIRLSDDAYGDPVNVAFKLGEDIASRGQLLVGESAHKRLVDSGYSFEGCNISDLRTVECSNVDVAHYMVTLAD